MEDEQQPQPSRPEPPIESLRETVQILTLRLEQSLKLFKDISDEVTRVIAETVKLNESLSLTNEALLKSLSENDQALDDLARITRSQLEIVLPALKQAQQQAQESQEG